MIFRILLLFLVIWGLFWILRKQFSDEPARRTSEQDSGDSAEDMLVCDTCGTHTPKSLTVQMNGKTYCCREHIPPPKQHDGTDDG